MKRGLPDYFFALSFIATFWNGHFPKVMLCESFKLHWTSTLKNPEKIIFLNVYRVSRYLNPSTPAISSSIFLFLFLSKKGRKIRVNAQ